MSSDPLKNVIKKWLQIVYIYIYIYIYKDDLALNNLQWLICGAFNKFPDFFV